MTRGSSRTSYCDRERTSSWIRQTMSIVSNLPADVNCFFHDTSATILTMENGFDRPTLAYAQAMEGAEHVKPRPTPAGAFQRAREFIRTGKRIDMVALAAELDVSRATLYRWTGDRERLLADAVWAEAHATADHMLERHRAQTGLARIQAVCVDFLTHFGNNEGVNAFLQHERDAGLELLTWVNGGFRPRLTAWIRDLVQDEIDAGHYSAPEDPQLLADGIVTIGERFLHHGGDPDVSPDPTSAGRMIALLLREPCDKPPGAATLKRPSTHVS
jgi:AcrR family transcriptional regulator